MSPQLSDQKNFWLYIIKSITSMSTATELKCTCTLHDGTIHRNKISDMAQNGQNHRIK